MVPEQLRGPTENAPAPELQATAEETLAEWVTFGLRTQDKKEVADERKDVALGIIENCEELQREAIEKSQPGFFGRLFG